MADGAIAGSSLGVAVSTAAPLRRRKRGQSRWVGYLFCLGCEVELREVLADEHNETYLMDGGDRLRSARVPCRDCGAEREFRSQRVRPMPPENVVDARR